VSVKRYTNCIALLAGNLATCDPPIDWPVLPFNVSAVISCVVEMVIVIPSAGADGIVIVPVAKVPAGFITRTFVPAAKVYENPVVGA
jgi:hypothetical protein